MLVKPRINGKANVVLVGTINPSLSFPRRRESSSDMDSRIAFGELVDSVSGNVNPSQQIVDFLNKQLVVFKLADASITIRDLKESNRYEVLSGEDFH